MSRQSYESNEVFQPQTLAKIKALVDLETNMNRLEQIIVQKDSVIKDQAQTIRQMSDQMGKNDGSDKKMRE